MGGSFRAQVGNGLIAIVAFACSTVASADSCTADSSPGISAPNSSGSGSESVAGGPASWSLLPPSISSINAANKAQRERAEAAGDTKGKWRDSIFYYARGMRGGPSLASWSAIWRDHQERVQQFQQDASDRLRPAPGSETNSDPRHDLNPVSCQGVIISSGELTLGESDISGFGLQSLTLSRSYRSSNASGRLFGPNWTSNFDPIRLFPSATRINTDIGQIPRDVVVTFPGGATYKYTADLTDPGTYTVKKAHAMGTLTYSTFNGTYWLDKDKLGHYITSTLQHAYTVSLDGSTRVTYSWNPSTRLNYVENRVGHRITFDYMGGAVVRTAKLTTPADPTGKTWTFDYLPAETQSSVPVRLWKVTPPPGAMGQREYLYELPTAKTLLTGMLINGVRSNNFTWDTANKRVTQAARNSAGSEFVETFGYQTNSTTLTTGEGLPVTYTFAPDGTSKRLTNVSHRSGLTCSAEAAAIFYDANGYIDYTVDWRNVTTNYDYDSRGRLLSLVRAAGTTNQLTTTFTWGDGINVTREVHAGTNGQAYLQIDYSYANYGQGPLRTVGTTDLTTGQARWTEYRYVYHPSPNFGLATLTTVQWMPTGEERRTVSQYDAQGHLTSTCNTLNHCSTWSGYNLLGMAGSTTDANGVVTSYDNTPDGLVRSATSHVPVLGSRTPSATSTTTPSC
jgi:hypothetical protein